MQVQKIKIVCKFVYCSDVILHNFNSVCHAFATIERVQTEYFGNEITLVLLWSKFNFQLHKFHNFQMTSYKSKKQLLSIRFI